MRSDDVMQRPAPVPASLYTRAYYLTECGGHEEFAASRGAELPPRMAIALRLAAIGPGTRVLDVGAGRGEALLHARQRGGRAWGLDYSWDAALLQRELGGRPVLADARALPVKDASCDVALMLDVVEHLHPHELERALLEVRRALAEGGRLVVHTSPSVWYYRFGYPLFRVLQRLRGVRLPADPRDRLPIAHAMHVSEQSPRTLRSVLRQAGFASRVFLAPADAYARERSPAMRRAMRLAAGTAPLNSIFCNDIFAVAWKREPGP